MKHIVAGMRRSCSKRQKLLFVSAIGLFLLSAAFYPRGALLAVILLIAPLFIEDGLEGALSLIGVVLVLVSSFFTPATWLAVGFLIAGFVVRSVKGSDTGRRVEFRR